MPAFRSPLAATLLKALAYLALIGFVIALLIWLSGKYDAEKSKLATIVLGVACPVLGIIAIVIDAFAMTKALKA